MKKKIQFTTYNFKPREGTVLYITEILEQMSHVLPEKAFVTGGIWAKKYGFKLSIGIKNEEKWISSDVFVDKVNSQKMGRFWQKKTVDQLAFDLLQKYFET